MTRIITITSGLAQVGKTHLAVNLALELARRGRQVGLYHELQAAAPVDQLLTLPQTVTPRRRATDIINADRVIRRGYLGIDILACELPLQQLPQLPADQLQHCIESMDAEGGYDDFLVDTSSMEPHTQLACCAAAALVIVVVTPDPHSQAEAFALVKVLQLNGFGGELCLLVNRVPDAAAAGEIRQRLGGQVQQHLGIELPLLGLLVDDRHIDMAQRSRQAFTALFPDSEAAGCVVLLADALEELPAAATVQTLADFWSGFLERARTPLQLTGDIQLEALADTGVVPAAMPAGAGPEQGEGMGLLRYEGELQGLRDALEQALSSLQVLAADVGSIAACLEDKTEPPAGGIAARTENRDLPGMAAMLLRAAGADERHSPHIQLQVVEFRVSGADPAWLRAGRYLRFVFRLSGGEELPEPLQALLAELPVTGEETAAAGQQIREIFSPGHSGCLQVITTPDRAVRIQVWLPADAAGTGTDQEQRAGQGAANGRLH